MSATEAEFSFEDVVLVIPSHEIETRARGRLPLSLISGRALVRDAGCGDLELVEVRIEGPLAGQGAWTLGRPQDTRSPYGAAAIAGALFRWIEDALLDQCRDDAVAALDDVATSDRLADAAREAFV